MAEHEWTSMPRWRATRLPAAASYLACWSGDLARHRVEELLATADPAVPVTRAGLALGWDATAAATLAALLDGCQVGVRVILAGPEAFIMRAAALARSLGASPDELVLLADEASGTGAAASPGGELHTAPGRRRVYCVTCRRPFDATAALGDVVACPGCASRLAVDSRFSRAHAAYLGWPAGLGIG